MALSGHKVTTYTTDANGAIDLTVLGQEVLMVDGLPVTYFPRWWFGRKQKPCNLFFSPIMGQQLRRLQPGAFDLILTHASFCDPGRMAAAASRRTGIPFIYYTHGGYEPWAFKHKYWKKRVYWELVEKGVLSGAAGMVVCNEAETDLLRGLRLRTPIRRIPWGVDIPLGGSSPARERLAAWFPALADRPFWLFLSRLHPKKGLDLLIPAFAALAREFPDWLLVLAGPDEGGYRAQLERMVAERGLELRILFTGMVTGEAKAALLAHADCFVLPSYSEGFPVVVVEALGYGRPVVITTSCYVPEVAEGEAGLVVLPEVGALAAALREMMRDPAFRATCSQKALSLAQRCFTWEAVAKQTLDYYREVIRCHSTA
ncbi:MAG: glycosyltransferase [Desulfobacterales bacterium]|nr:glycosyltransferase [Desulfobacterales bacterium]